jgi:hypothetical protein
MKKILTVVAVLLLSMTALAQLSTGKAKGARAAGFDGEGYFVGDLVDNTGEAVRYTQDYIDAKWQGYTLTSDAPVLVPMHAGKSYYVYAKDSAGKDYTFLVIAHGYIFGPQEGKLEDPRY